MEIDSIDELIEKVENHTKSVLSQKRYEHSVRTAQTCALLCENYHMNPKIGYLAGIAHDMCKEIPPETMLEMAKKDGMAISEIEQNKLSLLHGRAAAVQLKEMFGVEDKDILDAIAWHTFGKKGLGNLGKLLFVSDKVEPGRPQSTEDYRKEHFSKSLDDLTLSILQENQEYLEAHGKTPAAFSVELINEILEAKK